MKPYSMYMRYSLILLIFSAFVLQGCFGENRAPVTMHGGSSGLGSSGAHVVQAGDTLYSISKRYQIVMQDIAYANRIGPPFTLKAGQRLKLPPPREYTVRAGDTLYEIARLFNTSSSQLARQNDLRAPYIVRTGDVLKLPSERVALASSRVDGGTASAHVQTGQKSTAAQAPVSGAPSVKSTPNSAVRKAPPKRSSSKFLRPVEGRTISGYGPKKNGLHNDGINIKAPRGAPVRSAENGVVVYAGSELKGSGNLVLVRHEGRYMTAYAHMDNILIKRGQTVKRGQTIGTVGSSGSVSSPQLHFEVRKGTRAINPSQYLAG